MEEKNSMNHTNLKPAEAAAKALTGLSSSGNEGGTGDSKKKRWILPAAAAAVAVIAIGGGIFLRKQEDPKETVIGAFQSITAEGQLNPAEEIFGTKELIEQLQEGTIQTGLEGSLSGSSDELLNQLSGVGMGMDLDSGRKLMGLSLTYGGVELADAQIYMDDTQLMAAAPLLSGRVFTLDYANDLEGQLINSPYAAQVLEEKGIDIQKLTSRLRECRELISKESVTDLKALWKRYREGSKAIENLKAEMRVEKADKKEFMIEGQSVNCRGYHVMLSKESLIDFVRTTRDVFLSDETLKRNIAYYLELTGGIDGLYEDGETADPEEKQEALWKQVEARIDALMEDLENTLGDVTMDVYVRKDGKMAGFSYQMDTFVEEENVRFYGDVSFAGGCNLLENVNGALNIEDSENNVITLSLNKTGTYEAGEEWSGQIIGTLENAEENYQFIFDGDYQIADGSYEMKLDLKSQGKSQASFSANGSVRECLKGENVQADIDSLRLETTLLDGGNSYVEFSGSCYVAPLQKEIAQPSGVPFDILASSESEYEQVIVEITGSLLSLLTKIAF